MTWTKEQVLAEQPPIPVQVAGVWQVTTGRVVAAGNNPWVVAELGRKCWESRYSWAAILQALNEKDIRLDLEEPKRRPATPPMSAFTPAEWRKLK